METTTPFLKITLCISLSKNMTPKYNLFLRLIINSPPFFTEFSKEKTNGKKKFRETPPTLSINFAMFQQKTKNSLYQKIGNFLLMTWDQKSNLLNSLKKIFKDLTLKDLKRSLIIKIILLIFLKLFYEKN
jgi:hypothetical protein